MGVFFKFIFKIVSILFLVTGAFSGLFAFLEYFIARKEIVSILDSLMSVIKLILSDWLIIVCFVIIALIIYYWKFLHYAVASILPNRLMHSIKEIHHLEHIIERSISSYIDLPSTDKQISKDKTREIVISMLEGISNILASIYGTHVSVHIKLFKSDENWGNPDDSISNAKLQVYERFPSAYEDKLVLKGKLAGRRDNEIYKIIDNENGTPEVLKAKLKQDENLGNQENERINSAYNYVLGTGNHYWIGTNLEKDAYVSTSKNWEKYYKSAAVFLIAPVQKKHDGHPKSALGLLVADSPYKYTFANKIFLRNLLGYCTHRTYALLQLIFDENDAIKRKEILAIDKSKEDALIEKDSDKKIPQMPKMKHKGTRRNKRKRKG